MGSQLSLKKRLAKSSQAESVVNASNSEDDEGKWRLWGPYLAERQWGTVGEDYTKCGRNWEEFTYEQAMTTAYRLGEDGIFGFCDASGRACGGFSFWNGADSHIKERLFGVTPLESPTGEGIREEYRHGLCHPQYQYFSCQYDYPQVAFPYERIRAIERQRFGSSPMPPVRLKDLNAFNENKYFSIHFEFAKATPTRMFYRVTVNNRSKSAASIDILANLWFRNTWSGDLNQKKDFCIKKLTDSSLSIGWPNGSSGQRHQYYLYCSDSTSASASASTSATASKPKLLFTENETGRKDAFNQFLVHGSAAKLNDSEGTKASMLFHRTVGGQSNCTLTFLLSERQELSIDWTSSSELFVDGAKRALKDLCRSVPVGMPDSERQIVCSTAGAVLWNRQFYHFFSNLPISNFFNDIRINCLLTVPDKWEHPYMASWDNDFQGLALAAVDAQQVKREIHQRLSLMHHSGRLPCDEYFFDRVAPPTLPLPLLEIHRVHGEAETDFLTGSFKKLKSHLNWWLNRKDRFGRGVLRGGVLGVDFLSLLETNAQHESNDSLMWTGFYVAKMLELATKLHRPVALNLLKLLQLAASALKYKAVYRDGFFFPTFRLEDEVGVVSESYYSFGFVPLFGCVLLDTASLEAPAFDKRLRQRIQWLAWMCHDTKKNPKTELFAKQNANSGCTMLSWIDEAQFRSVCRHLFDENKFLSLFGFRSMSMQHRRQPISVGGRFSAVYFDAESLRTPENYGGNSNWTGAVSPPLNFLILEALKTWELVFGDNMRLEFPTNSGHVQTLHAIVQNITKRLLRLFQQTDPDAPSLYECYDADTGRGVGSSNKSWGMLVPHISQNLMLEPTPADTQKPAFPVYQPDDDEWKDECSHSVIDNDPSREGKDFEEYALYIGFGSQSDEGSDSEDDELSVPAGSPPEDKNGDVKSDDDYELCVGTSSSPLVDNGNDNDGSDNDKLDNDSKPYVAPASSRSANDSEDIADTENYSDSDGDEDSDSELLLMVGVPTE